MPHRRYRTHHDQAQVGQPVLAEGDSICRLILHLDDRAKTYYLQSKETNKSQHMVYSLNTQRPLPPISQRLATHAWGNQNLGPGLHSTQPQSHLEVQKITNGQDFPITLQ